AEYVTAEADEARMRLIKFPAETPWEHIPFQGLARGGVAWAVSSLAQPNDTVVVLGQGLVGNLVMQAHRARGVGRLIAVDTLPMRLELARRLGADIVIDAGVSDAVVEVKRVTGGRGADVVVDCVGGPPGLKSFPSALEMAKSNG